MKQIDELRQIIVGDNADTIEQLKQRIESVEQRTIDVAEVLPAAIDERIKSDNRLVDSFKEPVSLGLKQAIRTEPDAYAEILYPVMAPSIRRAISQAISSMLATINQTIESATSAQGLALRIESWRTSVPYGQLMLQRSVLFKVEHIYLIDRETAIPISQAQAMDVHSLDGDAVSAMFSAIESFVQDSFSSDENERLTEFTSDQYKVWMVHGSSMMLACVISGDPPETLRAALYDALDKIHVEYAAQTADFDGDASIFDGIDYYLDPLLQFQMKSDVDNIAIKKKQKKIIVPTLLACLLVGALVLHLFTKHSKLKTVEHFLQETPGVALTKTYWDDDWIVVEGMQDPDAEIPYSKLLQGGVEKEQLRLKTIPFRSLEVRMELQRFKKEFVFPVGVQLAVRNKKISIYGESPIQWLNDHDVRLRQLSADHRVNVSDLSASTRSVMNLLKKSFTSNDLEGVVLLTTVVGNHLVVEITGSMEPGALQLLNAMFAQNIWVNVSIK